MSPGTLCKGQILRSKMPASAKQLPGGDELAVHKKQWDRCEIAPPAQFVRPGERMRAKNNKGRVVKGLGC